MSHNILVVAFDGLDLELIKNFDCQHLQQAEFGRIDNQTGIGKRVTGELFASFLTGKGREYHAVAGKHLMDESWPIRASHWLNRFYVFRKWAGLRGSLLNWLGFKQEEPPIKEVLDIDTLFDDIPNSKAFFVPVETKAGLKFSPWAVLENDYLDDEDFREVVEKEHLWRKHNFFEALEQEAPYDFLMVQFHKPDFLQHVFGDPEINYDEEILQNLYEDMDELAETILKRADDRYDYVIFMSDHGLPAADQHNENAFYSVNREIGWNEPTMFDIHDFILETAVTDPASEKVESEEDIQEETKKRDEEVKQKLKDLGYI